MSSRNFSLFHLRNRHFLIIDILMLSLTPLIALALRINLPFNPEYLTAIFYLTVISLVIKIGVFYSFKLYSRYWRYASIDELVAIGTSVFISTVLITGIFSILRQLHLFIASGFPRSIPLIDGLLTFIVVGGVRFGPRFEEYIKSRNAQSQKSKRVIIVGAGDAGEVVAREMLTSKYVSMEPVGFVDDNPAKIGMVIHGIPVLGAINDLPEIIREYNIQEIIIAMPSASGEVIRDIIKSCENLKIPFKSVPGIYEMLSGQASISRIRNIDIEDLLRREPVDMDTTLVHAMISGKRVLITGAGGSIGTELCLQVAQYGPAEIIALGHGENSLFELSARLKMFEKHIEERQSIGISIVVADVRDKSRLHTIFKRYSPQIIFHAAAHKHVPLMEENLEDAISNNILGTRNLVELAQEFPIERFVFISTDKAVNSINVMGMTKRVAELIVREAASKSKKPFVSVRFGNVLGSRGSVVPFFRQQINAGGPVTVTHPEITRYFMTIPEAVELVLQAASLGSDGEVYVLDMGKPIKIVDLAQDLINLSGYQVGKDIEIVFTGLRPGEKLHEELFMEDEVPVSTGCEKIFVVQSSSNTQDNSIDQQVEELITLAKNGDNEEARKKLAEICCVKPEGEAE